MSRHAPRLTAPGGRPSRHPRWFHPPPASNPPRLASVERAYQQGLNADRPFSHIQLQTVVRQDNLAVVTRVANQLRDVKPLKLRIDMGDGQSFHT